MGIKQLYDNLLKLPNEYEDISVMRSKNHIENTQTFVSGICKFYKLF